MTVRLPLSRRQMIIAVAAAAGTALFPTTRLAVAALESKASGPDGLPRATPDENKVDTRAVLDFIDAVFAHDLDLHSFMLFSSGSVVAEGWSWPYSARLPHMTHSLTKSVTACAVGIAIDEGHFSIDDKVVSFFKGELPDTVNEYLAAMTVRDLLTMRAGHAESVSGSVFRPIKTSWVAEFFKIPVLNPPGTEFLYSSALSFMLSAIVSRTTGSSAHEFLEPRLFHPLGITGAEWSASPQGISSGGNGLSWKTADSLKLGILHLNKGSWNGQQIISPAWVEMATRTQVQVPDEGYSYGYHWWVDEGAQAYYAEGAFGQFTIVFPNHDVVLAITAGISRDVALEELIFKYFPAALGPSTSKPVNRDERELQTRLETMRLLPVARYTTSPLVERISGTIYTMESNPDGVSSVQLIFKKGVLEFRMADFRGDHVVSVGLSDWIERTTSVTGAKLHHEYQSDDMKVVAHALWWDDATLQMTWQFIETAWVDRVVCRFTENRISIDRRTNANYGPTVAPTLRGQSSSSRIKT